MKPTDQNSSLPDDRLAGNGSISFLDQTTSVPQNESPNNPLTATIDFSRTATTDPTANNNPATLKDIRHLFVGKSIASTQKGFKSGKTKFRFRPLRFLAIVFIILALAGGGYLGWRIHHEGLDFIAKFFRPDTLPPAIEVVTIEKLTCSREFNSNELISFGNARTGTESIVATYRNTKFSTISKVSEIIFDSSSSAKTGSDNLKNHYQQSIESITGSRNDPFITSHERKDFKLIISHTADLPRLDPKTTIFFAMKDSDGKTLTDINDLRRHYAYPLGKYNCRKTKTEQ